MVMIDLIDLLEYFDGLPFFLKKILVLDGKAIPPKLLILLLLLVHLSLLLQLLSAVLIATIGPIEFRLDMMTKNMRFQSLTDVCFVASPEIFRQLLYPLPQKYNVLIPLLVD